MRIKVNFTLSLTLHSHSIYMTVWLVKKCALSADKVLLGEHWVLPSMQ